MMPKMLKSSSTTSLKKPLLTGDKPAIQQTKQVPKPGKFGTEIDDIFGGRKKKKPELEIPEKKETKAEIAKWKTKKRKKTALKIPEKKETKAEIPTWKTELEIPEKKETKAEIAKWKRKRTERDDAFNNKAKRRPRKRTVEGFPVYTEDELCVNKPNAGATPLCPFDCNCCF